MPLWTDSKPPVWAPQSIATSKGWEDPVTGEVYVATGGQVDKSVAKVNSIYATAKTYKVGDTIAFKVKFSEAVDVTGTPVLSVKFNQQARTVNYASGSGSSVLTFNYTVQTGDDAAAGEVVSVSPINANGGTLTDTAGSKSAVTLTFTPATVQAYKAAGSTGSPIPGLVSVVVDATVPTVDEVTIASSAHDTDPVTGDVLTVTVVPTEAVIVTGTPRVTLAIDTGTKYATYVASASTSTSLKFRYTVVAEDVAKASDFEVGVLGLNGGTIKDAAGNPMTLTIASPPDTSTWTVNPDVTAPTVTEFAIASSAHDTHPVTGDVLTVTATVDEDVTVTGTPQVALDFNGTARTADYDSINSTATSLLFTYTVVAQDVATAGQFTVGDLGLNGGSIKDGWDNDLDLVEIADAPDVALWAVN